MKGNGIYSRAPRTAWRRWRSWPGPGPAGGACTSATTRTAAGPAHHLGGKAPLPLQDLALFGGAHTVAALYVAARYSRLALARVVAMDRADTRMAIWRRPMVAARRMADGVGPSVVRCFARAPQKNPHISTFDRSTGHSTDPPNRFIDRNRRSDRSEAR